MGGSFQSRIRAASSWRGFRLIALTSFYSPARRKACGYLFLTPRRKGAKAQRKPSRFSWRTFAGAGSRARVRSADARVLGVRLRLFYNGRDVAPSPLGGVGPLIFVTCRGRACCGNASKLARMAVTQPLLAVSQEAQAGVSGPPVAQPLLAVHEKRHRQECLCHRNRHRQECLCH